MPRERDIEAFDKRAPGYDRGWLGQLHHDIAERTARIAAAGAPHARHVLDVGCGTGYLLGQLAVRLPGAAQLQGVDPAPAMVECARSRVADGARVHFQAGMAEDLPFRDGVFDLVVSTTSFDHWVDQRAGLAECRRVLVRDGCFVLADQFSPWLVPTLYGSRRGRARTAGRAGALLREVGFRSLEWYSLGLSLVRAVSATA